MKNLEEKIKEIATRQDNCDLLDDCHYHDDTVKQILALLKSDHEKIIKRVEGLKKTIDEQALEILHRVELPNSPSEGNVRNKTLDEVVSLLKEGE